MRGVGLILLYYVIIAIMIIFMVYKGKKNVRFVTGKHTLLTLNLTTLIIIALASLMGGYSLICGHEPPISDRGNYAYKYVTHDDNYFLKNSRGLYFVTQLLYNISDNYNVLFFAIPTFCVLIYSIAINHYKNKTIFALILFGVSMCYIYPLYLFKQAPAIAFGSLSMVLFLNKKRKRALIALVIAVLFHETALILIPIYILVAQAKKTWVRVILYVSIIVFMLWYNDITRFFIQKIQNYIPFLANQLTTEYVSSEGSFFETGNMMTIVKGLPYYVITIYGIINKKRFEDKIPNYNELLLISIFCSFTILLSANMYWMWRFGTYGYLTMCFFASDMSSNIVEKQNKITFEWGTVVMMLFFTVRYLLQIYYIRGGV